MRRNVIAIGALMVAFGLIGIIVTALFNNDSRVKKLRSMKGRTDTEVLAALGQPTKIYEKATAPAEYYVSGYNFERRPITNKVFIYVHGEIIGYVYFDAANRVEYVYVGGS